MKHTYRRFRVLPTGELLEARGVIASSIALAALAAGAAGGGSIASAAINAHAAGSAADKTTAAANHAADLEAQANAQALAFQREQAENAYQNSETARHGNYDQWAAQQRKARSVGELLGLPSMDIPDYVPGIDPNLTGRPTAPTVGQAAGAPPAAGGDPVQSFMLDLLHRGVSPQDVADQANARFGGAIGTGAKYYPDNNTIGLPGFYVAGPRQGDTGNVWNVVTRGGAPSAPAAVPGSVGSYMTPYATVPRAPGLAMASGYPAGSVGSFLR
jgi:hypothetical protein